MQVNNIPEKGRILGVDYGDVRTGLAVSDPSRFLASGFATIKPGGMRRTAEVVAAAAKEKEVTLIVIGLPKNMDGSEGFRAETVKAFAALLAEETEIPFVFFDERLSTVSAHRFLSMTDARSKKRKAVVDTLSAEIILQGFLDSLKK